jgi:hypothetical protein
MKAEKPDNGRCPFALHRFRESGIVYRTLFDNATDGIFLMKRGVFVDSKRQIGPFFAKHVRADALRTDK